MRVQKGVLKSIRSRAKEFDRLSWDAWIKANSDIDAEKLHALGVVTFRWNLSENKLFGVFHTLLKCPIEEAHALADNLKNEALAQRIRVLASTRIKNAKTRELISNVLDVYDVCRLNRNQLTHFTITLVGPGLSFEVSLARRSRDYRTVEPFPQTIKDIRRVARDIRRLNNQLMGVNELLVKKSKRWMTTTPSLLPMPELLWKPPAQAPRTPRAARRRR